MAEGYPMDKKTLRTTYKQERAVLKPAAIEKLQDLLMIHFQQLPLPFFEYLHSYLPTEKEVDPHAIIDYLRFCNPGMQVLVPQTNFADLTMVSYIYNDETELRLNELGIAEPVNSQLVDNQLIDVVLVPLLAFDEQGNRVGYGKGFYDRFLQTCRKDVIKIGLSFFEAVSSIDDADEFDVPLNYCVTPSRVYEF